MQATSIWLLALVKRCPRRVEMKERLLRVQRAFMALLAEGENLLIWIWIWIWISTRIRSRIWIRIWIWINLLAPTFWVLVVLFEIHRLIHFNSFQFMGSTLRRGDWFRLFRFEKLSDGVSCWISSSILYFTICFFSFNFTKFWFKLFLWRAQRAARESEPNRKGVVILKTIPQGVFGTFKGSW